MDADNDLVTSVEDELAAYQELVRRVRLAPSRRWIDRYFDMIGAVAEAARLAADDPRLATTMPEARHKSPAIRVNINNRWVLVNYTRPQGYRLGIIYGPEYVYQPHLRAYIQDSWHFKPLFSEISRMAPTPLFLWLNDDLECCLPDDLETGWLDAVLAEARRARRSVYRLHHQPVVYRAATDPVYRQCVLDAAFPDK